MSLTNKMLWYGAAVVSLVALAIVGYFLILFQSSGSTYYLVVDQSDRPGEYVQLNESRVQQEIPELAAGFEFARQRGNWNTYDVDLIRKIYAFLDRELGGELRDRFVSYEGTKYEISSIITD
jgi:hypothetical protein